MRKPDGEVREYVTNGGSMFTENEVAEELFVVHGLEGLTILVSAGISHRVIFKWFPALVNCEHIRFAE
jgi:hypothetical protein